MAGWRSRKHTYKITKTEEAPSNVHKDARSQKITHAVYVL